MVNYFLTTSTIVSFMNHELNRGSTFLGQNCCLFVVSFSFFLKKSSKNYSFWGFARTDLSAHYLKMWDTKILESPLQPIVNTIYFTIK